MSSSLPVACTYVHQAKNCHHKWCKRPCCKHRGGQDATSAAVAVNICVMSDSSGFQDMSNDGPFSSDAGRGTESSPPAYSMCAGIIYVQFCKVLRCRHVQLREELVACLALRLVTGLHRPSTLPHVRDLVHKLVDLAGAMTKQRPQRIDADTHSQQVPRSSRCPIVWPWTSSVVGVRHQTSLALLGQGMIP